MLGFLSFPRGTVRRRALLVIIFINVVVFIAHECRFLEGIRRGWKITKNEQDINGSFTISDLKAPKSKSKTIYDTSLSSIYLGPTRLRSRHYFQKKRIINKTRTVSESSSSVGGKEEFDSTTNEDKMMMPSNDSIMTLVYERKRPRPNTNMDYFLKSSGWLDRQMKPNHTLYPYKYILALEGCKKEGRGLRILVTVLTSVRNTAQRMAIRDTWGKQMKNKGAKLLFFLGDGSNKAVQDVINEEWKDYSDIVQEDYLDSYYNLSIKTVSMLRWVNRFCPRVSFVFKTDDDIYVNVDALYEALESYNDTATIHGMLAHRWRPIRDKRSKWFVPFRNYPWAHYPDFVAGPAYIISSAAIKLLYDTASQMTPFFLEDVFLTGLVAVQAGVPRINQPGIKNSRDHFDPCRFNLTLTSHSHPSWDVRRRHRAIHSKLFVCRIHNSRYSVLQPKY